MIANKPMSKTGQQDYRSYSKRAFGPGIVAFYRTLATIGGGAMEGLFLSQACFLGYTKGDDEGWFWHTHEQWHADLGMTRKEQETARRNLRKAGIVEEKLQGVPAKIFYRIDFDRIDTLLFQSDKLDAPIGHTDKLDAPIGHTVCADRTSCVRRSDILDAPIGLAVCADRTSCVRRSDDLYRKGRKVIEREEKAIVDFGKSTEIEPIPFGDDEDLPQAKKAARSKAIDTEAFDRFWATYPRKDGKQAALKAWTKLAPDTATIAAIHAGLTRAKNSRQWGEEDGRYIPLPATFLNGGKWEDEHKPPPAPPTGASTFVPPARLDPLTQEEARRKADMSGLDFYGQPISPPDDLAAYTSRSGVVCPVRVVIADRLMELWPDGHDAPDDWDGMGFASGGTCHRNRDPFATTLEEWTLGRNTRPAVL